MFRNFKHQIACIQCSKKLINPITLFFKSTSSTSTKSHFRRKIQHFSGEDMDITQNQAHLQYTAQNAPKHAISSKNVFWGGA